MRLPWWLDWSFEWRDLSLAHRDPEIHNCWLTVIALRCECGTWGGCGEHWFCGICRRCLKDAEFD